MIYELPDELDMSTFRGDDVRKTMCVILDKYHELLCHDPLLTLRDFDYASDVRALRDALRDTLARHPLPEEVKWLILCLNEEDDPSTLSLLGYGSLDEVLRGSQLYPDSTDDVMEYSPEFFSEVSQLLDELDFDEDAENDAFEKDDPEAEAEFTRREAVFDTLLFDLPLLFLASAISNVCNDETLEPSFLLANRSRLQFAVMCHSGDPIPIGYLDEEGWKPEA